MLEARFRVKYNIDSFAAAELSGGKPLKLLRMTFQEGADPDTPGESSSKLVLVVDMEDENHFSTKDIPGLARKMEIAIPGIFPDDDGPLSHNCGGGKSGVTLHSFREEVEHGTHIPHLLEHVIMYLMSKRTSKCSAYCGQRSVDLDQGICTHYYMVFDYPSKVEAVVAVDLAMQVVTAWMQGKTVVIDPNDVIAGVKALLEPMVTPPVLTPEEELLAS